MSRLVLAVVAGFAVASAAAAADEEKTVRLVHVATGKVLAIADESSDLGARAVVVKENPKSDAQQWTIAKDAGFLKLTNLNSGKVLDVYENMKEEGAPIIQWEDKPCDNDNQRWAWEGEGKERRLRSKLSNLVLDVDDEGKVVQKKADPKSKSQLWRVVEAPKK